MKIILFGVITLFCSSFFCRAENYKYDYIYKDIDSLVPVDVRNQMKESNVSFDSIAGVYSLLRAVKIKFDIASPLSYQIEKMLKEKYFSDEVCGKYYDSLLCLYERDFALTYFSCAGYYRYVKQLDDIDERIVNGMLQNAIAADNEDKKNAIADTLENDYIPKDLDDAIENIKVIVSPSQLKEFLAKSEKDALKEAPFGFALALRNKWHIWSASRIQRSISKLGIDHPDNVSLFIVHVAYRKLNNLPVKLDELIEQYKAYDKHNK